MNEGGIINKKEVYGTIDQRLQGDGEFVVRVFKRYEGSFRSSKLFFAEGEFE
jgi:hypothetical protein